MQFYIEAFPDGSAGEESACNAGDIEDASSILGWGRPLVGGQATHCSILAWRIWWTEAPGGLQSLGSQRVGQDSTAQFGACNATAEKYLNSLHIGTTVKNIL